MTKQTVDIEVIQAGEHKQREAQIIVALCNKVYEESWVARRFPSTTESIVREAYTKITKFGAVDKVKLGASLSIGYVVWLKPILKILIPIVLRIILDYFAEEVDKGGCTNDG
jgi:hypothetical protein